MDLESSLYAEEAWKAKHLYVGSRPIRVITRTLTETVVISETPKKKRLYKVNAVFSTLVDAESEKDAMCTAMTYWEDMITTMEDADDMSACIVDDPTNLPKGWALESCLYDAKTKSWSNTTVGDYFK